MTSYYINIAVKTPFNKGVNSYKLIVADKIPVYSTTAFTERVYQNMSLMVT